MIEKLAALDAEAEHVRERIRIDSTKRDEAENALPRAILSEQVAAYEARLADIAAERGRVADRDAR